MRTGTEIPVQHMRTPQKTRLQIFSNESRQEVGEYLRMFLSSMFVEILDLCGVRIGIDCSLKVDVVGREDGCC